MAYNYLFKCTLPNGVHARPASNIEELANKFNSTINIINNRNGKVCNAKSSLSIIAADFRMGDDCEFVVTGQDEKEAFDTLKTFFTEKFPKCDEPLLQFKETMDEVTLPPLLRNEKFKYINGKPVVPGIAQGIAVIIANIMIPTDVATDKSSDSTNSTEEKNKIIQALQSLGNKLKIQLQNTPPGTEADILKTHLSLVRDIELKEKLLEFILIKKLNVAKAIAETGKFFSNLLMDTKNVLLQERVLDIQDVCSQLLIEVYGESARPPKIHLNVPSICVAENLSPQQLLEMDKTYLKGLVLSSAGTTSHAVILARSFGIPTLTDVRNAHHFITQGQDILVDADLGILITEISPQVKRYYELEANKTAKKKLQQKIYINRPAITTDNFKIEVAANAATIEEVNEAFDEGADGIGLFRTEILFMKSKAAPSDEEQFKIYRKIAETANNKPVIIRTLDVGGDKPLPYLDMPKEANPFLGCRGVRMYSKFTKLFTDQLKAIIRASAFGNLKIMIPMVSCLDEIHWVKKHINEIQTQYSNESIPYNPNMEFGIMIEIPSIAFSINQLCKEINFFSIGTNDLAQYFMAVDRENTNIAQLRNPLSPAFIKLLKNIVENIHMCGKWVGICGEMAGQVNTLPLLIGLGFDELSISSPRILETKSLICHANASECQKLVDVASESKTTEDVEHLLETFNQRCIKAPILDPNLIIMNSDSRNKHEAIKEIADNLYVVGRTRNPREIEEAIWQRENVYSTALGHGFAIPHCKTDSITSNSISVLKPKQPIDWETEDNKKIVLVILIVIRKSSSKDDHMRIFSKLARKLMNEKFTNYILEEQNSEVLVKYLKNKLEI